MIIITPQWVNHGNKDRRDKGTELQLYAIDIHPDGTKVATGGEGDLGGRVCIWNMKPILKDYAEKNKGIDRLLSKIDSHQQAVHALRWSHSGEYFASGGGDKVVMIWLSSGDNKYKSIATLRSHSLDVMDLAWSPNDEFLASASIDNSIVIWNAQQWPEIVKIIRKHDSFVKGVSWDPIGKYLASQSDDKTLRVWRISDWGEEVSITEPFENSNTSSGVTRIDWSPDGQFLVSAQAMNNDGFVSKIIERNSWSFERDFVGHRKNICCVSFSPHIFKMVVPSKNKDSEDVKIKPQSVLAIGSRDRSISVWVTSRIRPLVVVNDVFENSVMDLSWSPCGYRLMACSLDGSVVLMEFTKEDFGEVYSPEEKQKHLQEVYGKSFGTRRILDTLIEDVNFIHAQKDLNDNVKMNGTLKTQESEVKVNGRSKDDLNQKEVSDKNDLNEEAKEEDRSKNGKVDQAKADRKENDPKELSNGGKQVEIRQADGKKRIMTLLKPKNQTIGIETSSTSSESKTKIIIETYDEKNLPKEVKDKFLTPKVNGNESADESSDSESDIGRKGKSKSSRIHDDSSDEESIILRKKAKKRIQEDDEEDEEEEDSAIIVRRKDKKRRIHGRSLDKDDDSVVLLNEESQQSQSLLRHHKKHKSRPVYVSRLRPQVQVFASEKLSKQNHQNLKLFGDADKFTYATIEYPSHSSTLVKLTILENDKAHWCTVLSSPIVLICGNSQVIVAVCDDMTLNTFSSKTGARMNSSFVIEADIAKIMFGESPSHICVLTCEGKLWIWDVIIPRLVIKGISMIPILIDPKNNDKLSITKLNIDKNNVVISVSSGKTFQYEKSLKAWCLLKNTNDPLAVSANYKGVRIDGFRKEILNTPSHKLLNLFSANTTLGQQSLISFVEQQIMRTKLTKNYEEFMFWTKIMVQNLVQMHSSGFNMENVEARLRDLCTTLLGQRFPSMIIVNKSKSNSDDPFYNEQNKRQLLTDILKIMASQTSLQRLYLEFKEQSDLFLVEPMQT